MSDSASIPPTSRIRVLIADDHPVVREGLAAIVNRRPDMEVAGEAGNGREAVELYRACLPDVALIDLRMPDIEGLEAIRILRDEFPDARLIVITTYDGDEDIYRALQAGARGYLLKDAGREALAEAVRTVHAGGKYLPPEVAMKLAERMGAPELTARELEVLRLIATGRTNQEVGAALYITEGTVKAHVNSILNKLGVGDRTEAVMTALRRGFLRIE